MSDRRSIAVLAGVVLLSACASNKQEPETVAGKKVACKKVYVAGTRFPQTVCGKTQGLTDVEKERIRKAIGRPIVTEQD